ncbi:MAG: DUF1559 domain-containing protein [Planctomycetota bacterium]
MSLEPRFSRRAHTLLELIIVLTIVGMGFVVLIPQLLQSRDDFRQTGCALKQSQLAKAVLLFEHENNRLPVAGLTGVNPDGWFEPFSGKQFSWITLILPQLGLQETYDRIDFTQDAFSTGGVNESITKLVCPADVEGLKGFRWVSHDSKTGQKFGLGNYAAFVAPSHVEFEHLHPGALGGFKPGTDRGQRLARIKDGASNTFLLTDVRRRPEFGPSRTEDPDAGTFLTRDPRGAWALPWAGSSVIAALYHSVGYDDTPWVPWPNWDHEDVHTPNHGRDTIRPCPRPFDGGTRGMWCSTRSLYWSVAAPRSLHDGGVNAAFVDGRVDFISDEIDALLYAQTIVVNDGFRPFDANSRD